MNSILIISPYKHHGMWVFDDPAVGLRQEPFVAGADHVMDLLAAEIPSATEGFVLVFSARPFPGSQAKFLRGRADSGGHWYSWPERQVEGWLCPAINKYFAEAPAEIYAQAQAKKK